MNQQLLEFGNFNYPEILIEEFESDIHFTCCYFNHVGSQLAAGCNDGYIAIFDVITRNITKQFQIHVYPVCSVRWSSKGTKILSCSTDYSICLTDALTGECEQRIRSVSPLLQADFNPKNDDMFLVLAIYESAFLCSVKGEQRTLPQMDPLYLNMAAAFEPEGKYAFTGDRKGNVLVTSVETLEIVTSFSILTGTPGTTGIKSIEFSKQGGIFLVNTYDRTFRVYQTKKVLDCGLNSSPECQFEFYDVITKQMWRKCIFSPDGEYICSASALMQTLVIWSVRNHSIVLVLNSITRQTVMDIDWHPLQPLIVSIGTGHVNFFGRHSVQLTSSFVPKFVDVDEVEVYDEHEGEFDEFDEDEFPKKVDEVDVIVDVCTADPIELPGGRIAIEPLISILSGLEIDIQAEELSP